MIFGYQNISTEHAQSCFRLNSWQTKIVNRSSYVRQKHYEISHST